LVVSPTERDVFKVVHDCHASSKRRWIDHDGWLWRLHPKLHLLACGSVVVPLPVLPFRLWPLDLLVQRGARDAAHVGRVAPACTTRQEDAP